MKDRESIQCRFYSAEEALAKAQSSILVPAGRISKLLACLRFNDQRLLLTARSGGS